MAIGGRWQEVNNSDVRPVQVARYEARTAAAEAELAAVQAQIRALEMEAGVQTQNPVAPL